MIIHATRTRRRPTWYVNRVMRRALRLIAANPGFHRLAIHVESTGRPAYDTAFLVNPDCEDELRRVLGRVLVLTPTVHDDEPWAVL